MFDLIYNVLVRYYGRMYSYDLCESMTDRILENLDLYNTRIRVMNYLVACTSNRELSKAASKEIANILQLREGDPNTR